MPHGFPWQYWPIQLETLALLLTKKHCHLSTCTLMLCSNDGVAPTALRNNARYFFDNPIVP